MNKIILIALLFLSGCTWTYENGPKVDYLPPPPQPQPQPVVVYVPQPERLLYVQHPRHQDWNRGRGDWREGRGERGGNGFSEKAVGITIVDETNQSNQSMQLGFRMSNLIEGALASKGLDIARSRNARQGFELKINRLSYTSFGGRSNVRINLDVVGYNKRQERFLKHYEGHQKAGGPSVDEVIEDAMREAVNAFVNDPEFERFVH